MPHTANVAPSKLAPQSGSVCHRAGGPARLLQGLLPQPNTKPEDTASPKGLQAAERPASLGVEMARTAPPSPAVRKDLEKIHVAPPLAKPPTQD